MANRRFRLTVPEDDQAVLVWIGRQRNLSLSLRQLMKLAIEKNGQRDYFASDSDEVIKKPKRGRPPKIDAPDTADAHRTTPSIVVNHNNDVQKIKHNLSNVVSVDKKKNVNNMHNINQPAQAVNRDNYDRVSRMKGMLDG